MSSPAKVVPRASRTQPPHPPPAMSSPAKAIPRERRTPRRKVVASEDGDIKLKTEEFLDKYYSKLNGTSPSLKAMYSSDSHITWPGPNGAIVTLESSNSLEPFLADFSVRPQYKVTQSFLQPRSGSVFLMVRGIRTEADTKTSFVQSFLLCHDDDALLVMHDIMLLKEDSHLKFDAEAIPALPKEQSVDGVPAESVMQAPGVPSKYSVCIISSEKMKLHWPEYFCLNQSERMLKHPVKSPHPEVPDRIGCIMRKLEADGLLNRVQRLTATPADYDDVLKVHHKDYLAFVAKLPLSKNDHAKYREQSFFRNDNYCSTGTFEAAYLAAGAVIQACHVVAKKEHEKAFAIVRPPGHHASERKGEGFCWLNNVAIGVKYLLENLGIEKVLVVDFDVHHCNGTQQIFYESKNVLVFSTFCSEIGYPKSDETNITDIGKGNGECYNVNVPLKSGFRDGDILAVYDVLLIPLIKAFKPKAIVISAGFDAAKGDPLGKCELTEKCFSTLVDKVANAGDGRVVLALEGGYNLPVLARCASNCVRALLGEQDVILNSNDYGDPSADTTATVAEVKVLLSKVWDVFK